MHWLVIQGTDQNIFLFNQVRYNTLCFLSQFQLCTTVHANLAVTALLKRSLHMSRHTHVASTYI